MKGLSLVTSGLCLEGGRKDGREIVFQGRVLETNSLGQSNSIWTSH